MQKPAISDYFLYNLQYKMFLLNLVTISMPFTYLLQFTIQNVPIKYNNYIPHNNYPLYLQYKMFLLNLYVANT